MFKKIGLFVSVLYCSAAYCQLTDKETVTKSELLETTYAADTSASAVILSKKASTYFRYTRDKGFTSFTDVSVKIKILKKEGLKWANYEIPYYTGYKFLNDEFVVIKKAFTYNLQNGQIDKEKVTGESKFKDKINEFWSVKKLTFPNVKVGSVIEINYELRTENLSELPEFQFQYDIPVERMEYTTKIPEFYIYKGIKTGNIDVSNESVIENTSQSFANKYDQTVSMEYKQIKTVYKAEKIKALKEENYVSNIKNYFGKIIHELEVIRMPEEEPKHIASTWDDVAKSIYNEKEFGEQIQKFKYFLNDLKIVIKQDDTPEVKMNKVFSFLRNRMSWDGKYGYTPRKDVEIAYTEKVGNVAEINFILISMLKLAGLEVNPLLLSTRDNGVAAFPNKTFLNYVIALVQLDGKTYFLDASDKFSSPNQIPTKALAPTGIEINNDGTSTEVNLMPKTNSKTTISAIATITNQGEISGKVRKQYEDYDAYVFREKRGELSNESHTEQLERMYKSVEVSEYQVQNTMDLTKPIVENFSFKSANTIETIGDKMVVSPLLIFAATENPFKQETREYPVDFVYPNQEKYNISISLPEGYVVDTMPQSKAVAMPDNLGNFKYSISNNGNQIQLLCTIDVSKAVIDPDYYETLKNFYKEMILKQTEKIVLKKA